MKDLCKGSQKTLQLTVRRLLGQEPGKVVPLTILFSIVLKGLDNIRGHDIEAKCKQPGKEKKATVCSQNT